MLLNSRQKEISKNSLRNQTMMVTYSFPANLELNVYNINEIEYDINLENRTLMIYLSNEIRIICLEDMKIERIIDGVPDRIDSVGAYSDGIYYITSNNRRYMISFALKDDLCAPIRLELDSRILSHLTFEFNSNSILVTVSADKMFRAYCTNTYEIKLETRMQVISDVNIESVSMHCLKHSKFICCVINSSTLVFVNYEDWTMTYPINELYSITHVEEMCNSDDYAAFIWNKRNEDGKITKMLSLIKMPPENDEGFFHLQNHIIPGNSNKKVLDFKYVRNSLLILLQFTNEVILTQFRPEGSSSYSFNKICSMKIEKPNYIFARLVTDTYIDDDITGEHSIDVHFIYQKCLEIGTYQFINRNQCIVGTEEHAEKFKDYIQAASETRLINENSLENKKASIFSETEIEDFLSTGYFEYIGGSLLFKEPGMEGYCTESMADLRDFIEDWIKKMRSRINTRLLPSILKYFKPEEYGNCYEDTKTMKSKLISAQKLVTSMSKLYKYILHRRILQGKEKQKRLKNDRLNIDDVKDIKMIDRVCFQIESMTRLLTYLKWFLDNSDFFIGYPTLANGIEIKLQRRKNEKKAHYRDNLDQSVKNFVVSDSLFIEKIFEESGITSESPKAAYGSILKNSKFSDLKYEDEKDDEKHDIIYPLKDIEDFIVLLKATNLTKLQDYIILYTLLDTHYDKNESQFEALLQSLDLYKTYEEIKIYWTLDNEPMVDPKQRKISTLLNGFDTSRLQWHTSILQSLLELKNYDAFSLFSFCKELSDMPRNAVELTIFGLCKSKKFSQAFIHLLSIEDELNPIRYKNIFKLYVRMMLKNNKFDLLTSQHLTDTQQDIVKEYLQSDESGLHQLLYFSFMASRGSTLDAIKYTKELIDKIKREKIDSNRLRREEAEFVYDVLKNLIRMYSHCLPAVQKKFAFKFLNLEKGKYHIMMKTAEVRQEDSEHDMEIDKNSENEQYTPFVNQKFKEIADARVPTHFADPLNSLVSKDKNEGKMSILKLKKSVTRQDSKPQVNQDQNRGGFMARFNSPFEYYKNPSILKKKTLTTQKRDLIMEDVEADLEYQENDDDIQNGKQIASKIIKNLKPSTKSRYHLPKSSPKPISNQNIEPENTHLFAKRNNIESLDLLGISKTSGLIKKSAEEGDKPMEDISFQDKKKAFKESLLSGLPDRVRNFKPKSTNQEIKEEPMDVDQIEVVPNFDMVSQDKSQSPEPDTLVKPANSQSSKSNVVSEDSEEPLPNHEIRSLSFEAPQQQRRHSFELERKDLFNELTDSELINQAILLDNNTANPSRREVPNFSNANDDIEFEKRKRQDLKMRTLNFLYAGRLPSQNSTRRKKNKPDINVGSDYTPENEQNDDQGEIKLQSVSPRDDIEEDKDQINLISEVQGFDESEENDIKSERVYDQPNSFNDRISNRSLRETVRTNPANIRDEDRRTEGAELIDRVKNVVQRQFESSNQPAEQDSLQVVREVISDKNSEQSIVISSDNSIAAPPQEDPNIVYEALSSESNHQNSDQSQNQGYQIETRQAARRHSKEKYKGKSKYNKKASKKD